MNDKEEQAFQKWLPGVIAGTVSAVALATFGVQQAQGQEGPLATFGLSFGGSYTANDPGENESSLVTGLSFDLRSVTRTQSFRLSANGDLVFDENGFDFEQPDISVGYGRENRSTSFDVDLSYSIRDVDGEFDVIDPVTLRVIDLIEDDGTLESFNFNAGLETGRDRHFGTDTRFSYTDRTYSGTSDPDLTDLTSWRIGTTLRFDVDPRISLRSSASYRLTQEDDLAQTESRTTRFGLGGNLEIDPLWSASFNLGYSIFETEENILGSRVLTEEDGIGFSLSVARQFRDGTLGLSLARNISDAGAEDSLQISRDRELSNGGELAWSLGLVSFPSGDMAPIVSASYTLPTPRGSFSTRLRQATSVNDEDESVVRTSVALDYDQAINATSSWSLNGSLSNVDIIGSDADDQSRVQIGVSYNHALTRDWDLSTALRHRITYENGEEDKSASTLSLSLERSFSFRP